LGLLVEDGAAAELAVEDEAPGAAVSNGEDIFNFDYEENCRKRLNPIS
jgi:hypothetical protein